MDTPFMTRMARDIAERRIRVIRFEFSYMEARRREKRRSGAPDREPVLLERWREVIRHFGGGDNVFIGGKSLGGRMASMVADEMAARGLVCLGYPFHPPADPKRVRIRHLQPLQTPALIVQGSRDPFGRPEEVETYGLSPRIRVEWLADGDHSFKPRASSGVTEVQNLNRAVELVCGFLVTRG